MAVTTLSAPASAANSSWQDDAVCRSGSIDPELFFPVAETGPAARQVRAAKAVCARCPVTAECRDWALRAGETDGIWGGLTPSERRRMRRRNPAGRMNGAFIRLQPYRSAIDA